MNYDSSSYNPDVARDAVQLAMAAHFLRLLAPSVDAFCFQTFDDGPGKAPGLARTFHGTLAGLESQLRALNRRGAGIFFTPNAITFGARRTAINVVGVRAFFADCDDPGHVPHVRAEIARRGLPPSIVVESSPGKLHFYWLVQDCPLDRFTPMQRAIAAALGTDGAVCDLPRVMRLPGFVHRKGEPFLVRIIGGNGANYTMAQLEAAFPHSAAPSPAGISRVRGTLHHAEPGAQALQLRAHLQRFGGLVTPAVRTAIAGAQHGERHLMLRAIVARLVPIRWSDADVHALVLPATAEAWPDVDPRELADRLDRLLAWMRAQEAGKASAQLAAPARVAAAYGARRRAGVR